LLQALASGVDKWYDIHTITTILRNPIQERLVLYFYGPYEKQAAAGGVDSMKGSITMEGTRSEGIAGLM